MKAYLPTILGAGHFDSRNKFPSIKKTPPRQVECFELELFFEESGCNVINDKKYNVKKGRIIFAKPGDIRYSYLPFRCYFFHFNNLPSPIVKRFSSLPSVFEVENFEDISEKFIQIIKSYCSQDSVDNLCASAQLLLLLKELSTTETEENSLALTAKRYINTNYSEDLTAEKIADYCNISTSYLYKIYSKTFDIGPCEALLNRRIYKAKEMMLETDLSLSEIALRCGFNSQSYFSDCFKRRTGLTPKEFRQTASYMD